MSSTSKPKHTMADKASMKALLEIYLDGDERVWSWWVIFFKIKDASGADICVELNMMWIWYDKI